MALPIIKQTIDPEKAYIKSLTSVVGSDFAVVGDTLANAPPDLSSLLCCQKIYERIIQGFQGEDFKKAMAAAMVIEQALKQLESASSNTQEIENSKRSILKSYNILAPMDEGIAKKVSDCVREQAQGYGEEPEQASLKKWLLEFPGGNG